MLGPFEITSFIINRFGSHSGIMFVYNMKTREKNNQIN